MCISWYSKICWFHQYVWQILGGGRFLPHSFPHLWAAPKKLILNRVKLSFPLFVYCHFLDVSLFLEKHSITPHYFCIFGITQIISSLNTLFFSISLLGAILRYFGAHFRVCSSIFESYSPFYLVKFCANVCVLLCQSKYLEKFHRTRLSAGGIKQYFWACFGYIPQCIEKLRTFSWNFAKLSWC